MAAPADSYQARFERRWGHLQRAHVRALAWLLDAPDLLDPADPHWEGRIASLGQLPPETDAWLLRIDHDPSRLNAELGQRIYTRLGLYAEKLMAFYYREHGMLVAHGLQVRAARNDTIGEFDFLLDAGPDAVEHIEFATKFYLLEGEAASRFDTFVGPNLADSLGAKMRKIFDKQLALGSHPAAQALLPRPVARARALVKGWLFYPVGAAAGSGTDILAGSGTDIGTDIAGISARHCRGFWCALEEVTRLEEDRYLILPRLQWLAPYRGAANSEMFSREELQAALALQFEAVPMPVLVASVKMEGGSLVETGRGFIVPDNWRARAAFRQKLAQPA